MFNFPRPSLSLEILEAMKKRTMLSADQQAAYERLSRGYAGEKKFAAMLRAGFGNQCLQLYGLRLNVDGSEFEIDCLLIFQNEVYLLEIKNHQGDYLIDNNRWFSVATERESKNPLLQLSRSELLLGDFLAKNRLSFKVIPHLIFVGPSFYLYQAPLNSPIVFSGQLKRFIQKLHKVPNHLNSFHQKTAELLKAAHISQSVYEHLPTYEYHQLKKGITCRMCHGFMEKDRTRKLACNVCNAEESVELAVIRNVREYNLLFPDKRISRNSIYHWCAASASKVSIARTLSKYLTLVKNGRYSYYLFKKP